MWTLLSSPPMARARCPLCPGNSTSDRATIGFLPTNKESKQDNLHSPKPFNIHENEKSERVVLTVHGINILQEISTRSNARDVLSPQTTITMLFVLCNHQFRILTKTITNMIVKIVMKEFSLITTKTC